MITCATKVPPDELDTEGDAPRDIFDDHLTGAAIALNEANHQTLAPALPSDLFVMPHRVWEGRIVHLCLPGCITK